jgi:hypothetical protein
MVSETSTPAFDSNGRRFSMSKVYKIHPGIGIARVGKSKDGYFIAGETPDSPPFDIDQNGQEAAFKGYKDAAHLMRRQGVRFRVYEYDKNDATGELTLNREITAADAEIEWTVQLGAAKAAGQMMTTVHGPDGLRTLVPGTTPRNQPPAGFTRADLRADVTLTATGKNAGPAPGAEPLGRIVGTDMLIGEARTDALGRLVLLAGRGFAGSWQKPAPDMPEFLNNPTWFDDIADGPVDAKLTFAGMVPLDAVGAWVTTAPPDFAPDTTPVTTLYDIAQQMMRIPPPAPLTYPQDIEPILRRAAGLFFVNDKPVWKILHTDLATGGLNDNSPAAAAKRKAVRDHLLRATGPNGQMSEFNLTQRQLGILESWVQGVFQTAANPMRLPLDAAQTLDRAVLDRCVGGGFFPGIEIGTILRNPSIYAEFVRLIRGTFTDFDGSERTMGPGILSQRMACPWQADFTECEGNWWPAQRPDLAGRLADGSPGPHWDRGIVAGGDPMDPQSHLNMVQHFAQLGVIVADTSSGTTKFVETDRDPALDGVA